jgi:hypothetical protein
MTPPHSPYLTMSRRRDANISCYYRRPASPLPAVTKLSIERLKDDGLYKVDLFSVYNACYQDIPAIGHER